MSTKYWLIGFRSSGDPRERREPLFGSDVWCGSLADWWISSAKESDGPYTILSATEISLPQYKEIGGLI